LTWLTGDLCTPLVAADIAAAFKGPRPAPAPQEKTAAAAVRALRVLLAADSLAAATGPSALRRGLLSPSEDPQTWLTGEPLGPHKLLAAADIAAALEGPQPAAAPRDKIDNTARALFEHLMAASAASDGAAHLSEAPSTPSPASDDACMGSGGRSARTSSGCGASIGADGEEQQQQPRAGPVTGLSSRWLAKAAAATLLAAAAPALPSPVAAIAPLILAAVCAMGLMRRGLWRPLRCRGSFASSCP
jgi:hypothetical protein